jgi:Xaa-Pro aminopeptidase
MKSKSLAVFNSNDIMPTNADGTMPFRQNNDIFYLSGIDQEETVLLLFPDCPQEKHREVLFVRETNEEIAIWEGHKLTKKEATEVSGIQTVYWLSDFKKIFHLLMGKCDDVYLNSNEHTRAVVEVETRDARFIKWCKETFPLHAYNRITPHMHDLRAVKSASEIDQIQTACNITEEGFRRVLKFVKPGVMEYEIEAEYVHEFVRRGSRGFAYTPIVASGFNSCVLHYIENDQACKAGDLLLMDVGAEYGNYNADMTRTIPVSGRFTPRQKEVYNAVLRIMKEAKSILKTGILIDEYHKQVGEIVTKELLDLKLISMNDVKNQDPAWPAYKKYMMHGTSHHLGLDVHDVGNWDNKVAPGMVFTVEPGIYIREENFGIRLENDVVITPGGNDDLMKNIPIEAEEIEELMNSKVEVM